MRSDLKKIGLFSGTFDPIHFGHLNLAIQIKEQFNLDLILFSCVFCNPFKVENPPIASLEHRMNMVSEAIDEVDFFSLTDIESSKEKISYTIDALKTLKKMYINDELFLIISNEAAKDFEKWKNSNDILEIASVLVGARDRDINTSKSLNKNFINIPIFEISATLVRKRLKENLYCGHMVPYKVLEYIDKYDLYHS